MIYSGRMIPIRIDRRPQQWGSSLIVSVLLARQLNELQSYADAASHLLLQLNTNCSGNRAADSFSLSLVPTPRYVLISPADHMPAELNMRGEHRRRIKPSSNCLAGHSCARVRVLL